MLRPRPNVSAGEPKKGPNSIIVPELPKPGQPRRAFLSHAILSELRAYGRGFAALSKG